MVLVAHNVKHSNVSLPNLNAKYIAEILDWQGNFPKINDQFHLTNHKKESERGPSRAFLRGAVCLAQG